MRRLIKTILACLFFLNPLIGQNIKSDFNAIARKNDMMGGSIVVFCEDKIIDTLYYGKADNSRNIGVNANTKFRVASISKTITAIGIMQLVEKKLLRLDEDISRILGYPILSPYYKYDCITPKMLLSHTSSLVDGITYDSFLNSTLHENPVPDLHALLTPKGAFYSVSLFNNHRPGSYFEYANINYVILGTIIEKVSGQRFDQYCLKNILQPLGLNASFNVNDLENINDVAVLYRKTKNTWTPQADDYRGLKPIFKNIDNYVPGTNGARFGPQGGLRCSSTDLAQIFMRLMNYKYGNASILKRKSIYNMLRNHWTYKKNNGNSLNGLFRSWGLGLHRITCTKNKDEIFSNCRNWVGHSGEAYGLFSDVYIDTKQKLGFVFITNGIGSENESGTHSSFYKIEEEIFDAIEKSGIYNTCIMEK